MLFLNREYSFHCSSLSSDQLFEDVQGIDRPRSGKLWGWNIHCCYNGLVLVGVRNYPDKDFMLLLWNPSTRESVVLPNPKFSQEVTCTWGLRYDSTSDDYKILKIDGKERNEVLALKSGSWRKIDDNPATDNSVLSDMDYLAFRHGALDCIDTPSNMGYLAFVHGAFHWVDSLLNQSVATFSSSDEVCGEIPLPEGLDLVFDIMHSKQGVSVLGCMLCVYSTRIHHREYTFKLWVTNEYGVKESWNQLFTIQSTNLYSITPKHMFSDGEVLLRCSQLRRSGSVFKTSNESSGVWPQSDSECIQDGFVYTESLISPKLLTWY
ncbi:F-box protein CPR1-like [Capsicum annuum]